MDIDRNINRKYEPNCSGSNGTNFEDEDMVKIERDMEEIRAKHARNLELWNRLAERNRFVVHQEKSKELLAIERSAEMSKINHQLQEELMEFEAQMAKQRWRLMEANYQIDMELRTRLEVHQIKKSIEVLAIKVSAQTRAMSYMIDRVGQAMVCYNTVERYTEAKAQSQLAAALNQYYKSLIVDKAARFLLNVISHRLNLDPQFRFRLERPIRMIKFVRGKKNKSNP